METIEPVNLSLRTPDAAALLVRAVRAWAADIEMVKDVIIEQEQDVEVVVSIDLKNAHEKAKRCVQGLYIM